MKLSSKKRKTSIFGCAAAANVYLPAHVEAAGYTVQEKNPVSVMPINQAKFLKGQRFDLQVEVKGLADDFKVTVDGVDAEKYFGKKGEVKTADGVTVYCIPDVAFTKAGAVKVEAVSGGNKNVVNYTVTDAKAKKKAKNVICRRWHEFAGTRNGPYSFQRPERRQIQRPFEHGKNAAHGCYYNFRL